jgi:8-oxo-dGTP diphosphatase
MSKIKTIHDSEIPAKGQQVITACAFIHHNFNGLEKLFLPKRAITKKFLPGVFELPGGHIDYGEDIVEGLKREIMEEFGMNISVGDPFYTFTYINEIKGSHSIEVIYFAKFIEDISKITLNPEDHSEFIWIEEKKIQDKLENIKGSDDSEYKAIEKGFKLLDETDTIDFG